MLALELVPIARSQGRDERMRWDERLNMGGKDGIVGSIKSLTRPTVRQACQ